ncbi:MAG TPA: hypothetical protein VLA74_13850 [Nitrososphaeraceae archaeon]|nr:hypothetical protein [Nitrososphaeraceae archaeon]
MNIAKKNSESHYNISRKIKYLHWFVLYSQILTLFIILAIILQIILVKKYNIVLLHAETYLAHISTLVFLILLVFIFIRWYKSKRNYMIILFAISFSLLAINIAISLIYLDSYISRAISIYSDIKQYNIAIFVTNFAVLALNQKLSIVYDLVSILSFSFMWIATAILLSHYRYKLGRIKYFLLISIPLIYYLSSFESYIQNAFLSLILDSPTISAIFYILIFNITGQIGALFFSLSFLIASTLVAKSKIRQSLLISGIGIAIIFGSLEITTLQYTLYPPYGLITLAFMPLGSFLLFIGILTSAQNVSRNIEIRQELYKGTKSELSFLKEIGEAERVQELVDKCKKIAKRTPIPGETDNFDLEQGEVMEIIENVLNELKTTKNRQISQDKNEK